MVLEGILSSRQIIYLYLSDPPNIWLLATSLMLSDKQIGHPGIQRCKWLRYMPSFPYFDITLVGEL